jgi:hypothetical protein
MISPLSSRSSKQRLYSGVRRWWSAPVAAGIVAALAVLSACAVGGSSTANTSQTSTSTATATTQPTATPKPKPTSVPTTSLAYCQGLLSLADVNSIMKPAAPATNILFENDTSNHLSACSWAQGQVIAVLAVFFLPFPAGTSLESAAQQQLAKVHVPVGGSIGTTPVSGVGDQALYLSATVPTPAGPNYVADLVVADGGVLLGCAQTGTGSVPAVAQSELQEACLVVISQL